MVCLCVVSRKILDYLEPLDYLEHLEPLEHLVRDTVGGKQVAQTLVLGSKGLQMGL